MSRGRLILIAVALAMAAIACGILAITLLHKNIASYIAGHYQEYSRDVNGTRYRCAGAPDEVADTLADYQSPEARAAEGDNEYLRYSEDIVIVGPDGGEPCSIRVESLTAGYDHGAFIFLGPGFTPGSPATGSGGTPGGPGSVK